MKRKPNPGQILLWNVGILTISISMAYQVTMDLLENRLAEAHAEHLDRGCRLKPTFCMKTIFGLTALYIECQGCGTFEVVI